MTQIRFVCLAVFESCRRCSVDMGFIDHTVEGPQVVTAGYLRKVTAAVVIAVSRFRRQRSGAQGTAGPSWPDPPRQRWQRWHHWQRKDRRRPDPSQRPLRHRPPRKPELASSDDSGV